MANIFISYSRANVEFARRLTALLRQHGYDLWIDLEGIRFTADWWEDIKRGIDTADTFLLIMSPNSLASPVCHLEIEYARSLSKRILLIDHLPITRADASRAMLERLAGDAYVNTLLGDRNPMKLFDNNWYVIEKYQRVRFTYDAALFEKFRKGEPESTEETAARLAEDARFETQFADLLTAVEIDLEHANTHTRIHLDQQKWSRSGKNASYLMAGDELISAETWLAAWDVDAAARKAAGRDGIKLPQPTGEQREFIAASRKEEDRRRRLANRTRIAQFGLIGLVIVALIVIGLTGRQIAEADTRISAVNTQVAQGEARITSLNFASQAVQILNDPLGNDEAAALLAIRGLRAAYSTQADETLITALERVSTERIFTGDLGAVTGVAFHPDGVTALTVSLDGKLRVWDIATGELSSVIDAQVPRLYDVALSPDGAFALTIGCVERNASGFCLHGTVQLWDLAAETLTRVFEDLSGVVSSAVAFSPDGRHVLIAGCTDFGGGTAACAPFLRLWDVATGAIIREFDGHTSSVTSVAFSHDGSTMLSGSEDRTMRLWDVASGETIRVFEVHTDSVIDVAFSPDGTLALSGSRDRTLNVWQVETGEVFRTFSVPDSTGGISASAFSPDGRFVVASCYVYVSPRDYRTLLMWDIYGAEATRAFVGHTDSIYDFAFSPDRHHLLSVSADGTMRLWTIENPRRWVRHVDTVTSVALSPDGLTAISASRDHTLRLWDVATGTRIREFFGHTGSVNGVAFSPDGLTALSASSDQTLRLWDVATGETIRVFGGIGVYFNSVAFSPDGLTALSGATNGSIQLWDIATGQPLRTLRGHTNIVTGVTFSPDGLTALSGSWDKTLRLWDVATGETIRTLTGHDSYVSSVAFSPDGLTALSGSGDTEMGFTDQFVRLWDVQTGETLREYPVVADWVSQVQFSPDGQFGAAAKEDGSVQIWNIATGESVRVFRQHESIVTSIDFSPDGRYLLSGGWDYTVRLWDTDYHDLTAYACTRVFRDFTEDERELYGITDDAPTCPQFGS